MTFSAPDERPDPAVWQVTLTDGTQLRISADFWAEGDIYTSFRTDIYYGGVRGRSRAVAAVRTDLVRSIVREAA